MKINKLIVFLTFLLIFCHSSLAYSSDSSGWQEYNKDLGSTSKIGYTLDSDNTFYPQKTQTLSSYSSSVDPPILFDVNQDGYDDVLNYYDQVLTIYLFNSTTELFYISSQTLMPQLNSTPYIKVTPNDNKLNWIGYNETTFYVYEITNDTFVNFRFSSPLSSPFERRNSRFAIAGSIAKQGIVCQHKYNMLCAVTQNNETLDVFNISTSGILRKSIKISMFDLPDSKPVIWSDASSTPYVVSYCGFGGTYGLIVINMQDLTTYGSSKCGFMTSARPVDSPIVKGNNILSYEIGPNPKIHYMTALNLNENAGFPKFVAVGGTSPAGIYVDDNYIFMSIVNGLNVETYQFDINTAVSKGSTSYLASAVLLNLLVGGNNWVLANGYFLDDSRNLMGNITPMHKPILSIINGKLFLFNPLVSSGIDVFTLNPDSSYPDSTFRFNYGDSNELIGETIQYSVYQNGVPIVSSQLTGGIEYVDNFFNAGLYQMRATNLIGFNNLTQNFTILNGVHTYNFNLSTILNKANINFGFVTSDTGHLITGINVTSYLSYYNESNSSLKYWQQWDLIGRDTNNGSVEWIDMPSGNYSLFVQANGYDIFERISFFVVRQYTTLLFLNPLPFISECLPQITKIDSYSIKQTKTFYPYEKYDASKPQNNPCIQDANTLNSLCVLVNSSNKEQGYVRIEDTELIYNPDEICRNQLIVFNISVAKCDAEMSNVRISYDGTLNLNSDSISLLGTLSNVRLSDTDFTKFIYDIAVRYNDSGNKTFSAWPWSNSYLLYKDWSYANSHGAIETKNFVVSDTCNYELDSRGAVIENKTNLVQVPVKVGFIQGLSSGMRLFLGLLIWGVISIGLAMVISLPFSFGQDRIFGMALGAVGIAMSLILSITFAFLSTFIVVVLVIFCVASIGLSVIRKSQGE